MCGLAQLDLKQRRRVAPAASGSLTLAAIWGRVTDRRWTMCQQFETFQGLVVPSFISIIPPTVLRKGLPKNKRIRSIAFNIQNKEINGIS
jgi:hypothetical protein